MTRWRSLPELGAACAQSLLEALPVYALTVVAGVFAPRAEPIALTSLAALPVACVLLARFSLRWPVRFVLQRLLLMAAGALLLLVWLHHAIAPSASWQLRAWRLAVTEPWRLGLPIGGAWVFWVWMSAGYLTYRGLLIGTQNDRELPRWFGVGAIAWVLLFAFLARAGLRDSELPRTTLRALAVSYFVLGLTLTALDRRRRILAREGLRVPVSMALCVALGVPIGCVTCAAVLALDGLGGLGQIGAVAWQVVNELGRWLWQALALFGHGLQSLLYWLGRFGPSGEHGASGQPPHARLGDLPVPRSFGHGRAVHVELDALPVVLVVAGAIALVFIATSMFRRQEPEQLEQSESLFSAELLEHDLRGLWAAFAARLRRARAGWRPRTPPPSAAGTASSIPDMRAAYRALLRWAKAHGQVRATGTTPDEFALQLAREHPSLRHEIQSLTRYYVAARYGNAPIIAADLAEAQRLLRTLTDHDEVEPPLPS